MATILFEDRGSFIFFVWEGFLTEEEITSVATEHFPRLVNRNKLFDMTRADFSGLTFDNLVVIAEKVRNTQPSGGFPKTALVAKDIGPFTLLSRYVLLAFQSGVHVEYRVFRDVEHAEDWLKSPLV